MKRVTVYNEKGGSGKTTATLFLASWLASRGHRVLVIDFDSPTFHIAAIRFEETASLMRGGSPLASYLRAEGLMDDPREFRPPYEIARIGTDGRAEQGYLRMLSTVDGLCGKGYDYVLYDFPGRFAVDEPVSLLCANGYVDAALVPVDSDTQTMKSAIVIGDAMRRCGVRTAMFWNRTTAAEESAGRYCRAAQAFSSMGLEFLPHGIRLIRKFTRDSSERLFVRSTMCFPGRYADMWCPTLRQFLQSAKTFIDGQ